MSGEEAIGSVEANPPRRLDLLVVARRPTGHGFLRLSLDAPPDWVSLPGQFLNVLCESDMKAMSASEGRDVEDGEEWPQATGLEISRRWPVVRRPFSISRVGGGTETTSPGRVARDVGRIRLEVLVRSVGTGSRFLHARPVGSLLNVVGPLGNHFTAPADDQLCILVGGGCGVAPIFGLADYLTDLGKRCLCFFGAKDAHDMPVTYREEPQATDNRVEPTDLVEEFAEDDIPTVLATEDGSAGYRGKVTEALSVYLRDLWKGEPLAVYGCGPTPMLKALGDIVRHYDVPCQVSLERFMGCGIGVCLSCATKRRDPLSDKGWTYRLTCRDGPVVDAAEMIWD
jgi:dihydroorotate dehydrogenase electron transfer subunit